MIMPDKDIVSRIRYLIKELNFSQLEFSKKIDVDASNLSKYLNGHLAISDALVNRIVINLGVNKDWLVKGTDLPYGKQNTVPSTVVSPGELAYSQLPGTPVYDIDVTAGTMPRARMFCDDQIIGVVNLPDISEQCRIVRVSGDSMSPVIRSGDLIAVRELSNLQQIFWGQIYVVLLDDYRLVKYVRKNPNPAMVTLRSENKNYDDMDIHRDEIRDMMFVQHIIHLDTRN